MCQAMIRRLPHRTESCHVRKVASLLTEPLNCQVVIHDDGSQPSMYDLRIAAVEAPEVAI